MYAAQIKYKNMQNIAIIIREHRVVIMKNDYFLSFDALYYQYCAYIYTRFAYSLVMIFVP
jgi:hypothetical protein